MAEATDFTRRNFFKTMGLSMSAVTLACSRAPVEQVVPFLVQPEALVPGVALWYASTCGACPAACGILAKTRDGRPIKIEGNPEHPASRGGLCAAGQAAVLGVYDASRARGPVTGGQPTSWRDMDGVLRQGFRRLSEAGRGIRLVTPPLVGPSGEAAIAAFLEAYPTARRVRHGLPGIDAVAEAHRLTHGVRATPVYRFDRARVIASFGADFLGTWLSPVAFTRGWAARRDPAHPDGMSRHFQIEPHLTLTGASADVRFTVAPSDVTPALAALARRLGVEAPGREPADLAADRIDRLASELQQARGEALVVAGSDDVATQALANAINESLGNYGATVDLSAAVPWGDAETVDELLAALRAGDVGAAVFLGVNPVHTHPHGRELGEHLAKVELTVSTADRLDETASRLGHLAPDHHFLESWGDSEPERGRLAIRQPALAPLYETRSAFESLLTWSGAGRPFYDVVRARWERDVFPTATSPQTFDAFWDRSVHDGVASFPVEPEPHPFRPEGLAEALGSGRNPAAGGEFELVLQATALGDGALANNGWLQELPDPVTKVSWGNPAQVAPETARRLGVVDGDMIQIAVGDRTVTVPVAVQPGTHPRAVALGLGYGRTQVGPVGNGVGVDAFPLAAGGLYGASVRVERAAGLVRLAKAQEHDSQEGRGLARSIDLDEWLKGEREEEEPHRSMWPSHSYPGHRWAMAIDLARCTGCSACVVSCQAENNIPIVGADEVRRRREMQWLRLDRYYEEGPGGAVEVAWQPMLCQHCENAPCETVCPVLATVHSSEGLNQNIYNRCVGTRYCENNCPFKVRRFNWFEYSRDETERLVLNPDVVVRSRGVTEGCNLCVQRIQDAKGRARAEGRPVLDGEVKTACQQSCPADAIVAGDLNDPDSRIAALVRDSRAYRLLRELNVEPAVRYLARVRNPGERA